MRKTRAFLMRLGGLFHREESDRDFSAEIESHLEMEIEDNIRRGMSPDEARRQALVRLGGLDASRAHRRDV